MNRTVPGAEINWSRLVAPYARPDRNAAVWQVLNTLTPFLALWLVMFFVARVSYWLVLPLALLTAGFWVRTFIIFHDCCHGSFFKSRRANEITGAVLGILTLTPFYHWRHDHAIHHATAGNIDKRYTGDVPTMTVQEYLAAPWWTRAGYRIMRNPWFLLTVGATAMFALIQRFPTKGSAKRELWSVLYTDLGILVLAGALAWLVGWKPLLLVVLPVLVPACAAGVWGFYVQHQFEGVYWETNERWSFAKAGLEGSSFYKLPRVLQWFSGNIGFHHIHHLSPRVPNYHLEACYRAIPAFHIRPLTIETSLKCARLHLIDERTRQLVGWEALGARAAGESGEQIAESLGVKPGRVYRLLRKRGVLRSRVEAQRMGGAPKPVRRVREELPAEGAEGALARYAAGEPVGYIGAALGVSAKSVYWLLRERGVLRSKSEARRVAHARRRASGEGDRPANA